LTAEHALGVAGEGSDRIPGITFLLADDRHRMREEDKRPFPVDVGILAANDPVALDRAACDMLSEATGTPFRQWSRSEADPESQIRHAEKIGLGNSAYRLLTLSP